MLFRTSKAVQSATEAAQFVLVKADRWNDDGYFTLFDLYRVSSAPGSPMPIGCVKILQSGQQSTLLPPEFDELPADFCSLGQSLGYYEALASLGGESERVLDALRDIRTPREYANAFRSNPGFDGSLLRFAEARWLEAGMPRLPVANIGFRTVLRGFDGPHEISFCLSGEKIPRGRIGLLVGNNGSGKTELLGRLAMAFFGLINRGARDERFLSPPPLFSRVIALSYSAFDHFDRPPHRFGNGRRIDFGTYRYAGLRYAEPRLNAQVAAREDNLTPGELEFVRPRRAFADLEKQIRCLSADHLSDWTSGVKSLGFASWQDVEPSTLPQAMNLRDKLSILSSGEKVALLAITALVTQVEPSSLVLFDEPETHLHPELLSALMRVLYAILERQSSFAIVATHSPMVIQEIPGAHVRILAREGNSPLDAVPYPGESFGENLSEIVSQAFRVGETSRNYVKVLRSLLRTEHLPPSEIEERMPELGTAARLAIASVDRERPREPGK